MRVRGSWLCGVALVFCLAGCDSAPAGSTLADERTVSELGLSDEQVASLESLRQADDYPLYTMHLYAPEPLVASVRSPMLALTGAAGRPEWGCSLFAALADPESRIFGRNFDWEFSPSLLLFNHPPDGYLSVSMVDIAYLGYPADESGELTLEPLSDLVGLLGAHRLPFDGMNEAGLAVGMAAVPDEDVPQDPTKQTVDSLGIIRLMLDRAATVEEAVALMRDYNVDFEGQVFLHYLLADSAGDAALVEYHDGEIRVIRTETNWHHATNFQLSEVDSPAGRCGRFDTIASELESNGGTLGSEAALSLLAQVAQPNTQWSIVYNVTSGEFWVAMGQAYDRIHSFSLES
jgi:choloylglycine hydrolase